MARVTVEDCLKNVRNRFELVVLAAKRARQIMRGKEPKVEWDNDKPTVVALREIAAGFTTMHNVHSTETHEEPVAETFHEHDEQHHDEKHHDDKHEASIAHPSTPTDEE